MVECEKSNKGTKMPIIREQI